MPQTLKDIVVMLLLLWLYPVTAPAGELSEVAGGPKLRLQLHDLAGQQRRLDEFEAKVLLVNFWASWCAPCLEELPSIRRLAGEMLDKPFAVIGINVGETKRRVRATAKRFEIDFPVLLDEDGAVFKDWGANVLPTTYVLDLTGRVRYIGRGPLQWDRIDIAHMLRELAEE